MRKWVLRGLLLGVLAGLFVCWRLSTAPVRVVVQVPPVTTPAAPSEGEPVQGAVVPAPSTPREPAVKSASGVPFRVVRRARIDAPSPPYGPQYAALDAAARGGDPVAEYRLGLLLYECRDVPVDGAALARDVEETYATRQRGGFEVADPHEEERSLDRRYQECSGVPAEARGKFRDWIRNAADAGLVEAQLDLPLRLPQADYCQYLSECPPKQRAQQEALQKEAIEYVDRARDAGSATALWTIGGWYAEGEVVDENDVEAYANFRALDEINEAAGMPRRFDQMLADLRRQLRAADLLAAEARATEILSNPNCCVVTP